MNRFTPKERAEIVTMFIKCNRSVVATQRAYRQKYRGRSAPKSDTIRRLASNFENHGSVADRPHSLHDQKVTVWAGVCSKTIIGPFFFRVGETVNGDRYRWMLAHSVLPEMREKGLKGFWFQQDGATCHTAKSTMNFLRQKFPGRVVSKGGDIDWPPRSPDLTAPDFFLWGFLKSKVYANKPKTLDELKDNIRAEITAISPEMLANVMENARKRAEFCIRNEGGHLIDVVFGN